MKHYFFLFLIILSSCSKEEKYTGRELFSMAENYDKKIEIVPIPDSKPEKRVICAQYGKGCVVGSGKRILIRMVEMPVIEFESTQMAKEAAIRLNQWHARNWLLDDVTGEPVLEDFVSKALGAVPGSHKTQK